MKKKVLFISLSTLLFILLLETACRIGAYFIYSPCHTSFSIQAQGMWINDDELIYDSRPNYLFYNELARFNEDALRVDLNEIEIPVKQKGETWILLIGGSSMLGNGANRDNNWRTISQQEDHGKSTSIDGYLEQILNKKEKGKYRVFNAAVAGYKAWQAFEKAKRLMNKYSFDWVISMDGMNEPKILSSRQSVKSFTKEEWSQHITQNPPLATQISWMKNSALVYSAFKWKYEKNEEELKETEANHRNSFIQKCINTRGETKYLKDNQNSQYAALSFFKTIEEEDQHFTNKKIKHLHFIQPHLSLRNKLKADSLEIAVLGNFYKVQKDTANSFMKIISEWKPSSPTIMNLNEMHELNFWVFVDYCHFTKEANHYIANKMAALILR